MMQILFAFLPLYGSYYAAKKIVGLNYKRPQDELQDPPRLNRYPCVHCGTYVPKPPKQNADEHGFTKAFRIRPPKGQICQNCRTCQYIGYAVGLYLPLLPVFETFVYVGAVGLSRQIGAIFSIVLTFLFYGICLGFFFYMRHVARRAEAERERPIDPENFESYHFSPPVLQGVSPVARELPSEVPVRLFANELIYEITESQLKFNIRSLLEVIRITSILLLYPAFTLTIFGFGMAFFTLLKTTPIIAIVLLKSLARQQHLIVTNVRVIVTHHPVFGHPMAPQSFYFNSINRITVRVRDPQIQTISPLTDLFMLPYSAFCRRGSTKYEILGPVQDEETFDTDLDFDSEIAVARITHKSSNLFHGQLDNGKNLAPLCRAILAVAENTRGLTISRTEEKDSSCPTNAWLVWICKYIIIIFSIVISVLIVSSFYDILNAMFFFLTLSFTFEFSLLYLVVLFFQMELPLYSGLVNKFFFSKKKTEANVEESQKENIDDEDDQETEI